TDLFETATIRQLLRQWQTLLQAIVEQPDARVAQLSLLSAQERSLLLQQWNATTRPWMDGEHLAALLAAQVARTPDRIAVVDQEQQVSYIELQRRALQLAAGLQEKGVGPEVLVGVYLPRSLDLMLATWAIFAAGGAYVPLDPASPAAR